MDNAIVHDKNGGCKNEKLESSERGCLSDRLHMEVKPEDVLLLSVDKPKISHFDIQNLFLQHIFGLNKRIPKQIMGLEEKYLCYCLELLHVSSLRANLLTNPSKVNFLPGSFSSIAVSTSGCDTSVLVSTGAENVDVGSSWDPIIGTITRCTSMMNILNSPLMRRLGVLDDDNSYEKTSALELEVRTPMSSAGGLWVGASHEGQKERVAPEDQILGSEQLHKRLVPLPSINSTLPDPSSSSLFGTYCQGTLQCLWNDGFPHYVFYIENKRKVLTTNLSKVESLCDKGVDYIYTFHSRAKESDLVGEMRVSTSFELCPHGTEIMETRFVLCANGDDILGDAHTSDQAPGKTIGLPKKVANIFRGHSYKQRLLAMQENLLDPSQGGGRFPSPKLELAAIVVRDHHHNSQKEVEIGGWGLKFLRKDRCECCGQTTSHCSTSTNVLLPAGSHSGPRTRNGGGPSGLVERWRSGGSCDCGGWDLGCPLTVLHARPNQQDGVFGEDMSFDLFVQGHKQGVPVLKMVKIHDGLYNIPYKSTLSALQSLSVVVAAIHSHSPTFRAKLHTS